MDSSRCSAGDVAVDTLPVVQGQVPVQIARRALEAGRLGGYDVVLSIPPAAHARRGDDGEAAKVKRAAAPHEALLVADALTGQDAVNLARASTSAWASPVSCSPASTATGAAARRSRCAR